MLAFQGQFKTESFDESSTAYVSLGCTDEGTLLTELDDGSLMCMAGVNTTSPNTQFELLDISASLARADGGGFADLSMSDTVYSGVFLKMITDNIFYSFVDGNFAGTYLTS